MANTNPQGWPDFLRETVDFATEVQFDFIPLCKPIAFFCLKDAEWRIAKNDPRMGAAE